MTASLIRRLALALLAALLLVPLLHTGTADAGGSGRRTLSGVVRGKDGRGIPGALVQFDQTRGTSDATGHYVVTGVPDGLQVLTVDAPCFDRTTSQLTFTGDRTKDFTLERDRDAFGHVCVDQPPFILASGDIQPLTGDDASLAIPLPFPFPFYGASKSTVFVSTNGYLTFTPRAAGTEDFRNAPLLDPTTPTDGIFAFWDDLTIDAEAQVRTSAFGVAPKRTFGIEWSNAGLLGTTDRITVDLLLDETGRVEMSWTPSVDTFAANGGSATIGIRNGVPGPTGQAVQRSFDIASVTSARATDFVVNHPPVAHAGPDRTVASGAGFILDGSGTTDPDGPIGLVFSWKQTAGVTTTIKSPHQAKTSVAGVKGPKTLTYQLKAVDPFGRESIDSVTFTVKAPV